MDPKDLVKDLRSARNRFLTTLDGLSADSARVRPDESEWSVVEVAAHMVDVDAYYLGEAMAVVAEAGRTFSYFDDNRWKAEHPSPLEFDLARVTHDLGRSHEAVFDAASALTEKQLATPCLHPRGIPYTAGDILYRLVAHDDNHAQQVSQIRQQMNRPLAE